MPNELLDLNRGQVQAVIDGYSERILDEVCNAVWTGYYAAYYFSKHPKKPTEVIKKILNSNSKGASSRNTLKADVDMEAELEVFAQRDLAFLQMKGGNYDGN